MEEGEVEDREERQEEGRWREVEQMEGRGEAGGMESKFSMSI